MQCLEPSTPQRRAARPQRRKAATPATPQPLNAAVQRGRNPAMIAALCLIAVQGPRLLVVNQGDKTLSVVDPATNKQVAVIDQRQTTMHGHEIAVGPDNRAVYMPVYGSSGVGSPGLDGSEMVAFDWPTGK